MACFTEHRIFLKKKMFFPGEKNQTFLTYFLIFFAKSVIFGGAKKHVFGGVCDL